MSMRMNHPISFKPLPLRISIAGVLGILAGMAISRNEPLSAQTWSVMTYNVRYDNPGDGADAWPYRVETVAATIGKADVIGLQEVLSGQKQDLQAKLPEFENVGVGRDDGHEGGEQVPIFYRSAKFRKIDEGHFWLSKTPDKPGSKDWDAAITRMVTWVVLEDVASGSRHLHLNTHFDHMGEQSREESAKLILQKAANLYPKLALVLTGDFNCSDQARPYEILTSDWAFQESQSALRFEDSLAGYSPAESAPPGSWNGFKKIEKSRIDFIFTARGAKSEKSSILNPLTAAGRFASDHLPVLATVSKPVE